ncbi:cytochrome d ubiquinol oxidase subunit II [Jannaschia helgolandensis]|uniref:Cytochrome bd-I ubiquinol oxidase subunit 2 apoprotein n=1 Tax=Jannaschia helgolandensis TaxID=188906 RepID=A0A1H7LPD7_9RHOB|nr:cytochrome d ubiquinol oxidase subunit II [Jannaschia helgolandensis]SEL00852.1 cytochrome bd-I ubiquinol oxidase subunit 2 apoprotein [Jannaschia helgolandensis]|tara:strand:+ start:693 stop:1703 length:1011 start_codon:yes stop_codon:yes gene_type:complete
MTLIPDLATILAFVIAFAIFLYVVMDGFDLGVALLFPFFPKPQDRDVIMNTVAPVWDGNETWLVLGGGAVFAAFPLAYAVLMPALYAPIIAMLLGLVFRGVAFEFRWRTKRGQFLWDIAFTGGSLVAALGQGIALGTVLQGITVEGRAYAGGWWDWLTPFTMLTGAAVVVGYAALGATWLILKTTGDLRDRAYALAPGLVIATLGAIALVSAVTPFLEGAYWQNWFAWPRILLVAPVPLAVVGVAILLFRMLAARRDGWPFVLMLTLFGLCFVGLGVSIFPFIVPGAITIYQAAAPEISQRFILVGVSILIPIILAYTAYAYWVFRGKIDIDAGYH